MEILDNIRFNLSSSFESLILIALAQLGLHVCDYKLNYICFHSRIDIDNDPNRAPPCDPAVCVLPDCFCSEDGTSIPGNLPSKDVPMMITITFDDAINNNNIGLYKEIFNGKRKNPNGCDIKATYFVSHKYTNYSAVQETHRKGHEIAVHSIT